MDKKIGLSIFSLQSLYGDLKAIEMAKLTGCDCIDLDIGSNSIVNKQSIYSKSEDELLSYYDAVKKKADEVGLIIEQTHGRLSIYGNNPEFDDAVLENARLDCLVTKTLGCPTTVMHNVSSPDKDAAWMYDKSYELFSEILKYAKKYDVVVATETFGRMGSRDCCDLFANVTDYLKIYNRIIADGDNAKYFKMCVDTGHTNTASHYNGNPSPADMIRILGKNIVSLHLHDNDSYSDQHKMPFMGTIDWNDVFDALDEIGYNGCYNMEIVLNRYGNELAVETGAYAVKLLKNFLSKRK